MSVGRTSVRCVVLAQGLGRRGESGFLPAQIHLLGRTLKELSAAGVADVTIVDGDEPAQLRSQLEIPSALNVDVCGDSSWQRSSASVVGRLVKASTRAVGNEELLLVVRGNRPPGERAFRDLLASSKNESFSAALMVVKNEQPLVGENSVDEWKVCSSYGRVSQLGMDLENYDGLSAGHCLLRREFLEGLPTHADISIEDVLTKLPSEIVCVNTKRKWPLVPQPVRVEDEVEDLLKTRGRRKYTLLNPGPVNTTAKVKSAMVHQDLCHRDRGFEELMASLSQKLRRIFKGSAEHSVCILTGSGTAAMESALTAVASPTDKLLIIDNGAFGERMVEVATVHGIEVVHLKYDWGEEVRVSDVRQASAKHPDIAAVSMIHHETSVGVLNPVRAVGQAVRELGALFVVDAVSSLGAEDLDVVRDNIDVCFSSANKCLHAVSGVGFVCVAPHVWERTEQISPRSFYLDLRRYRNYARDRAQTPFTPAVSSFFALEAACREFLADGHESRIAAYRARNARLRAGLESLGMPSLSATGRESHSLVTCRLPREMTFVDFYHGLRARGYIVYACKGPLENDYFQVANMGDITGIEIDAFLGCAGTILQRARENIERSSGKQIGESRSLSVQT